MNEEENNQLILSDLAEPLTDKQKTIAEALVQNNFQEPKKQKSLNKISEELDVSRAYVYELRTQNVNFIRYKSALADIRLREYDDFVSGKLIDLIRGGNNGTPSVKALELYMKLTGKLTDRHEVVAKDERSKPRKAMSDEELQAKLDEMSKKL